MDDHRNIRKISDCQGQGVLTANGIRGIFRMIEMFLNLCFYHNCTSLNFQWGTISHM
jgi:hypothetical protein